MAINGVSILALADSSDKTMLSLKKLVFLSLMLLNMTLLPQNCFAQTIDTVDVTVKDVTAQADSKVLERMSSSILAVAEQILSGKTPEYIKENEYVYKTVLLDIANRVFTGYDTEEVHIICTKNAQITLLVRPWQETVQKVKVNLFLSNIDDLWAPLVRSKLGGLETTVEKLLKGIPIDASDWAGVIAKKHIREQVEENLPSFKANVDIASGKEVVVDIVIIPVGRSVKSVKYDLLSDTMPSLILLDARKRLGNHAASLTGMPLDFLSKNKKQIEKLLVEETEKERIVKTYELTVDVDIAADADTEVTITLDSSKYRVWIEGYADIGRDDSDLSGKAHIGRFITKRNELFLETTLYTGDVKWKFDPGISHKFHDTTISFLYRMPDDQKIFRLEHKLFKNWYFRIDKFSDIGRPEYAIRYRIHEFLAAEVVFGSDKDNYFRVVGNL